MKTRLEYNLEILEVLKYYFTRYPYMRFCQGLFDLEIIDTPTNIPMDEIEFNVNKGLILIKDSFNEESSKTLKTIKGTIQENIELEELNQPYEL